MYIDTFQPFDSQQEYDLYVYEYDIVITLFRFGYDNLVYVEGLHLSGSMQAVIHIDYDAPFPHIACISATFVRRYYNYDCVYVLCVTVYIV